MSLGILVTGAIFESPSYAYNRCESGLTKALASAASVDGVEIQRWKDVGLKLEDLERFLNEKECYASRAAMFACGQMLNAIAQSLSIDWVMLPITYSGPEWEGAKIVHDFGLVKMIEPAAVEAADFEYDHEEHLAHYRAVKKAWQALKNFSGDRIPFRTVLEFAYSKPELRDRQATLVPGILNAGFGALDPHSRIEPIANSYDWNGKAGTSEFVGIGFAFGISPYGSEIVRWIVPGSPAAQAGLRPGDQIVAIDSKRISSLNSDEAIGLIRGGSGSRIRITIRRSGRESTLKLRRRKIQTSNAPSQIYDTGRSKIGYLALRTFLNLRSPAEMKNRIREMEREGVRGLVLDLRDNGGGIADVAQAIGGLFLGPGKPLTYIRPIKGKAFEKPRLTKGEKVTDLPLVVLVDAGSASGSELLSGALQDYRRAWIVGEPTFGKGSVQENYEGAPHGLRGVMYFKTTHYFYTPLKRALQGEGVIPDFEIQVHPKVKPDQFISLRETDLYPGAPDSLGTHFVQTRKAEIGKLKECMESTGRARDLFYRRILAEVPSDYQFLNAADLIECL